MLILGHPGPALPHPEVLEFQWWAYVIFGAVLVLFAAWILYDLSGDPNQPVAVSRRSARSWRSASRSAKPTSATDELVLFGDEGLIVGRPSRARSSEAPELSPEPAATTSTQPQEQPPQDASVRGDVTAVPSLPNPVRIFGLVLGMMTAALAVEHVRAVEALAGFIRSSNADQIGRLAMSFLILIVAGTALVIVRPRGAALCFAAAGGVGIILATAESWQNRIRWWDAAYILDAWQFLPQWSVVAFTLAGIALVGAMYKPRRPLPGLSRIGVADHTVELSAR